MKTLAQRLLEVQKEVGKVAKTEDNPFYKSKYFDINQLLSVVKPVLSKHGVVLVQPLQVVENPNGEPIIGLGTMLINADDPKDVLKTLTPITNVGDAQKMGASVTYFRRYALQSILGLEAEDDDANSIVQRPKKKAATTRATW